MANLIQGVNDLATTHPELAKEWHPTKNGDLKPTDVTAGSSKKIWWYLPYDTEDGRHFDFEWEALLKKRAYDNHGCPYLSSQALWIGYNDLATTNPELAKEWHPTKNGNLKPTDVFAGSNKKVWWYCSNGHEWTAIVNSRSGNGVGCPICNESHLEKSTRNVLYKYGYNFTEQVKFDSLRGLGDNPLSFDFAINNPDGSLILVECQGEQHYRPVDYFGGKRQHKKQLEHDRLKQEFCEQNHILLIQIPYCYDEEDIDAIFRPE